MDGGIFKFCNWFLWTSQPLDTTADQKALAKQRKKSKVIPVSNFSGSGKSAVIYVGRIPHGFYEEQMRGIVWGLIHSTRN